MQKAIRVGLFALATGLLPATGLAQSCNIADRSVLLILDASGSMNAKLPNGETRIAVAQRAIKGVAGFIPAQAQLQLTLTRGDSTQEQAVAAAVQAARDVAHLRAQLIVRPGAAVERPSVSRSPPMPMRRYMASIRSSPPAWGRCLAASPV